MRKHNRTMTRRDVLPTIGAAAAASAWLGMKSESAAAGLRGDRQIATNTYPWMTFARRAEQSFEIHSDELLADIASAGIAGYEPIIESVDEFDGLDRRLGQHGLEMRSIYVNSALHEPSLAKESVARVSEIAAAAHELGTRIVVTNPSPIRWGGPENKSDAQLRTQAQALDRLGARLRDLGLSLAYHNHDAELRQGGREFHHMLTATDPEHVRLCLDSHWVFRGCGDSEVALFDALTHYWNRIVELHLRQSADGVWTEVYAMEGDIDYTLLFEF
ncbi:MAG: sugar phosphate isomerase/epimerase, partial [Planctomycetota bacterium]